MESKKLYVVRHGQTDFNRNGIVQGSGVDSDINETGQQQADSFFQSYKHVKFDKVYTSELKRTHQSVARFIQNGIPHKSLKGFNEISWGDREGQRFTPEENAYYREILDRWGKGETSYRIQGGESPEDVQHRIKEAMDHVLAQSQERTVLICMHGRAMRVLMCTLLNYPLHLMDSFEHSNLGLYLLNYTGSMFSVEKHNDVSHLNGLIT